MLDLFKSRFISLFNRDNEPSKIGIFGPPNAGKSTLTNQICNDFDEDMVSSQSPVSHETREVNQKKDIEIEYKGSEVNIDIVDTPGVATEVDDSDFIWVGMDEDSATRRAKEATEGIAESMHWLKEDVEGVIYMMDSTKDPFRQVNTMLLGIIESRDLPVIVLANKIDIDDSDPENVANAFPQHTTIPVSSKEGTNMDKVYKKIAEKFG
jgi:small GTP-binding protein